MYIIDLLCFFIILINVFRCKKIVSLTLEIVLKDIAVCDSVHLWLCFRLI